MSDLPPNIDFARHEREAMADFQGRHVYSRTANAFGYANLRVYSGEAAARLAATNTMFTIHPTVAADVRCHGLKKATIKITGASNIIICEPGIIGSKVHLNAIHEKIILRPLCMIFGHVYIGPGVVIEKGARIGDYVVICGETEIDLFATVASGVQIG